MNDIRAQNKSVMPVRLPVRIWGMDKFSKPFSQTAQTIDVRSTGTVISGVHAELMPGDTIGLQSGDKKGRFRVVSVGPAGTPQAGQVELEGVQIEREFWVIPASMPGKSDGAAAKSERRAYTRYEVAGTASIRTEQSSGVFEAKLTDISLGGCYAQTYAPLPISATLTANISLLGRSFKVQGVVRTCHPYMGMGIQFLGDPDPTLREVIDHLTGQAPGEEAHSPPVAKADATYTSSRLQSVTDELGDLGQLIQCTDLDPSVLRQFRTALGDVRNTAWAIERYMESQAANASTTSQLQFLAYERIRLATQLCRSLAQDIATASIDPEHLQPLVMEVIDLVKSAKAAQTKGK
jgi:hypothetical protein